MTSTFIFLAVFALSYLCVESFRRWVLKREMLDIPNERSSHDTPTPRGGGAVIVAICIAGHLAISCYFPEYFSWGYVSGAVLIALISWLDDLYSIWFMWRFLAHTAAAILLIVDVGYERTFFFAELGVFGAVVTAVWIVWLLNAYNFMDGIDGIAGSQAVIAAIGWAVLANIFNLPSVFYFGVVIGASSLGFLIHNWQPARIFMGDVGSAFLGFTFAAMPLIAIPEKSYRPGLMAIAGVLFLWFFILDTVITFIARLLRRQNVFNAHREHIYQKLVISGMSHAKVTVLYGILTLLICTSVLFSVASLDKVGFLPMVVTVLITTTVLLVLRLTRKTIFSHGSTKS